MMPHGCLPELPRRPLRIVFQHTSGPYPGLTAIMGLSTDFGLEDGKLPTHAEGFEAHGRVIAFAGLVKLTTRYALYREPLPFGAPNLKSFHEEQQ